LFSCTPVSLLMLKCSCAHTIYHVFSCIFLLPVLGMLILSGSFIIIIIIIIICRVTSQFQRCSC
jgi:hypothetical protein